MGTESASREGLRAPRSAHWRAPRSAHWRAPRSAHWRTPRAALIAFVAIELIALPLLLFWGRHGWFTQDDWDFLSARTIGSADDLFRAHFQHWTTLPILPYRLLWTAGGIRSYVPYQAMIVVLHLVAVALLFAVMRRAGVRPWIATVTAGVFVFFGSGAENILVAFQITFVGALVFGLTQLLLADHDGAIAARDWLGLLAGLAALMCSGVGITMVLAVGLAVLLRRGRRGWPVALFHTAPLALAYLLWYWLAPTGQPAGNYQSQSPSQLWRFVVIGFEAAFARLGQVPGVGFLLAAVLAVGVVLALLARRPRFPLGELGVPLALLGGSLAFLLVTGAVRAGQGSLLGPERARISRYVYVIAALALPALALGADAIITRWRAAAIPVVIVLLLGLPGNIHRLATPDALFANSHLTRTQILALPRFPLTAQLRDSRLPVQIQNPRYASEGLTYSWLIKGVESGRIPEPGPSSPTARSTWTLQNFFVRASAPTGPVECRPAGISSFVVLDRGDRLTIERGAALVTYAPEGGTPSLFPIRVKSATMVALAGPLRVRVVPQSKGVLICT